MLTPFTPPIILALDCLMQQLLLRWLSMAGALRYGGEAARGSARVLRCIHARLHAVSITIIIDDEDERAVRGARATMMICRARRRYVAGDIRVCYYAPRLRERGDAASILRGDAR